MSQPAENPGSFTSYIMSVCTTCTTSILSKKNLCGYRPNLNYFLTSVASQDTTTCQSNSTTYARTESMSAHYFTQALAHIHFPFLNPSSFGVVSNNLASHAHVIPPSHIDCTSAFQDINTIKNAVTTTHTGHRDMVAGD